VHTGRASSDGAGILAGCKAACLDSLLDTSPCSTSRLPVCRLIRAEKLFQSSTTGAVRSAASRHRKRHPDDKGKGVSETNKQRE
jgi:hypothetical protein